MQLSKSDYMMFLKHPCWLWLKKHDPEKLPPVDPNVQAIFNTGHAFEAFAEARFPEGVKLGFDGFAEYRTLTARTQAALHDGAKTLFQGRVEAGELTCVFDVLDRVDGNTFDLYEIKSSTKDKPEHCEDLAFQKIALERAGLVIRKIFVIVVNSTYVREGDIDPEGMTHVIELTDKVEKRIEATTRQIEEALTVMHAPERPDISPRHAQQTYLKDWLAIFHRLHLNADPYSIYAISPPNGDLIGELEDQGLELIHEIPDSFEFGNGKHRRQVELTKLGKPVIQSERVKTFLSAFAYPLYFFDYETIGSVVPPMDGMRPYQQLPMQYSLHILHEPDGELEHREFLHRDTTNPGPALIEQLRADIGERGSVIVWNEGFEKQCNTDLGEMFPEHKTFMAALNDRIVDLMTPFKEGWYEDHRFLSSASIKKVLPVLVPELSYKALNIQEGQTAQRLWMEAVLDGKHPERREQIMEDLLRYCELDTLAMVRIYEKLLDLLA